MAFLTAVGLFPLVLAGLSLGAGLLVERLAGLTLPFALIPALGFGALVVVSQLTTWTMPIAPLTPWILLVLALAGFVSSRPTLRTRWRARGVGSLWPVSAGLATYLCVSAPVILAGRRTFSGYLLDTTNGIQLAGAERLLHYGHNFTNGFPGYGQTLVNYFGRGYPSGAHTVLSSVGWLSGQDLLWIYSPYQAMELAFAAMVLTFLAAQVGLSRPAAAFAGWIAAIPALVYAYALMGSIKELTVLPLLLALGALVTLAPRLIRGGARAALPFAVVAAAALGAIGIAASPWIALFGVATLAFAAPFIPRGWPGWRMLAWWGVLLAGGTAVLALPTVGPLSQTLGLAKNISNANPTAVNDPGNLLRPLLRVQALGVWLGGSHRLDPRYLTQTYALVGIVAVCAILGLFWIVRLRSWRLLAVVAISVFVWALLTHEGTHWTDAKLLMLISPVVMLVAMIGALGRIGEHRLEAILLSGVIAVGVLGSDALLYHGNEVAPTQRFAELRTIGLRFAHQGPTLATDFDEYGFYLLREMHLDEPGIAYHGSLALEGDVPTTYGHSYDIDAIDQQQVQGFRTIVMRNSPRYSRPPGNFALVFKGSFYSVWRRVGASPKVHLSLGTTLQPAAQAPCRKLGELARMAMRGGGRLAFVARAPNVIVNLATAAHSPAAVATTDLDGLPEIAFGGPARVTDSFEVTRAGTYKLWLGGDADRAFRVSIDGREVGAPAAQTGGDGNMIGVAIVKLEVGSHRFSLIRGGGTLYPGDNSGALLDAVILEPVAARNENVQSISPLAWHTLCGRTLDWVEVE
jgi:hypothetical protein